MRNCLTTLALCAFLHLASISQEIVIGGSFVSWKPTSDVVHIDGLSEYPFSHSVLIYTAEELGPATFLSGLGFNKKSPSASYNNGDALFNVRMIHTTLDAVSDDHSTYLDNVSEAQLVYSSSETSFLGGTGWQDFMFSEAFDYNGSDNLMVLLEWQMPGTASGDGYGEWFGNSDTGRSAVWRSIAGSSYDYFQTIGTGDRPVIHFYTTTGLNIGLTDIQVLGDLSMEDAIQFKFENPGGLAVESLVVEWTVNGIAQPEFIWNGYVPAFGASDWITLPHGSFDPGYHEIVLTLTSPNGAEDLEPLDNSKTFHEFTCDGPLGGSYIIGPGGDFVSFTAANVALSSCGVNGPVTLEVLPGVYNEQLELNQIAGTSEENTVHFTSLEADSSSVMIQHETLEDRNWVFKMNNADFVSFSHIGFKSLGMSGYNRVLVLEDIDNMTISNCHIEGAPFNTFCGNNCFDTELVYVVSNPGVPNNDLKFYDTQFKHGKTAIHKIGTAGEYGTGVEAIGNLFYDQYFRGVHFQYQSAVELSKNKVRAINVNVYLNRALYLHTCPGDHVITENDIVSSGTGISLNNCQGGSEYTLVANNMILVDLGSCAEEGIDLYDCSKVKVYYNTAVNYGTCGQDGHGPLRIQGSDFIVRNNVFINNSNTGLGPAITYGNYGDEVENLDTDFNLLYGVPVVHGDNIDYTLEEWQEHINGDYNSLEGLPEFAGDVDMHCNDPLVVGNAIVIESILTDIDGDPRDDVTPNLGADEYVPVVGCQGDLDQDGVVTTSDLLTILSGFGPCSGCPSDINGDGVVNIFDLLSFLPTYGTSCE